MWRYEPGPPGKKPIKVPFYANGGKRYGRQGTIEDRSKLTTFAAARDAAARGGFDGVGLALLPEFGITALDFDNCVGPDGDLPHEIAEIVNSTYAEYSPSGRGVRAFVKGDYGNRKSKSTDDQFGFETFTSSGFVTFTGNILPVPELVGYHDTISDRVGGKVHALCAKRFTAAERPDSDDFMDGYEPRLGLKTAEMEALLNALDPDMERDQWIRVGAALHHECEGDDTGLELWSEWSSGSDKYPGEDRMRVEWDSFTRRAGPGLRQVTMASVIRMAKTEGFVLARDRSVSEEELDGAVDFAADQIAKLGETADVSTPEGYEGKFPVLSAAAITEQPPVDWLIRGVLPDAALIVMYGEPGSGKSFMAIDFACSIARGVLWRGNEVEQGNVVYIAAEGERGIGKRFKAYGLHHDVDMADVPVGVIPAAPNFLESGDISEVVAAVTAAGGARLLVVDTMAQVTPGANENSSEDMGRAIANAQKLHKATGATVLIIGHSGKDASRGMRGWSGVKGALDAEFETIKHDGGAFELHNTKQKDGEDQQRWGFKLHIVETGTDKYGKPVTSCVAIDADVPVAEGAKSKGVERFGRNERHVLECIHLVDGRKSTIRLEEFVALCAEAMPEPEPVPGVPDHQQPRDTRRQNMRRAIRALSKRKEPPLEVSGQHVTFLV